MQVLAGGEEAQNMCTLRAGVVLCIVFVTMLLETVDDSFTSTIRLYPSPSQLCLIKRMSNFKVPYQCGGFLFQVFLAR